MGRWRHIARSFFVMVVPTISRLVNSSQTYAERLKAKQYRVRKSRLMGFDSDFSLWHTVPATLCEQIDDQLTTDTIDLGSASAKHPHSSVQIFCPKICQGVALQGLGF